jgi:prepilin-type processing-associated H-X9-DG protein
MSRTAPGMANLLGDAYWYLPYAVTNEKMGLAFLDAYVDYLAEGKTPPDTLEVPQGMGAGGGNQIFRLQPGVHRMFIRDINNPAATAVTTSEIPVMIAQPKPGATGASVLYMDGHVDFVEWGEFPVTKDFINALKKVDPPEYAEPENVPEPEAKDTE